MKIWKLFCKIYPGGILIMLKKLFGLLVVLFAFLLVPVIASANYIEGHVTQSETVWRCPDELIIEYFGLRRDFIHCPDELIFLQRLENASMRGEMVGTTTFHFYIPIHPTHDVSENIIEPRGDFQSSCDDIRAAFFTWGNVFGLSDEEIEVGYETFFLSDEELTKLYEPFATLITSFAEKYNLPLTAHTVDDVSARIIMALSIHSQSLSDFESSLYELKENELLHQTRNEVMRTVMNYVREAELSSEDLEFIIYTLNHHQESFTPIALEILNGEVNVNELFSGTEFVMEEFLEIIDLSIEDQLRSIALWQRENVSIPCPAGSSPISATVGLHSIRNVGVYAHIIGTSAVCNSSPNVFEQRIIHRSSIVFLSADRFSCEVVYSLTFRTMRGDMNRNFNHTFFA